jgi:hypothetical protein
MKTKNKKLNPTPQEFCDMHDACKEGRDFALQYKTMADVWDSCPRVDWMRWIQDRAGPKPSNKKLRLFACWCVRETPLADGRKVWDLLTDERSRNAVIVAERHANGDATDAELAAAWAAAGAAAWAAAGDAAWAAARDAARDAAGDAARAAARAAAWAAARDAAWAAAWAAARDAQTKQFRAIFPNPFRKKTAR